MEDIINLVEIMVDTILLFFCCESIFREKQSRAWKDLFLIPVFLIFLMASRVQITAGGYHESLFSSQGFEIVPSNNLFVALFLILAVMVANSLYYKPVSSFVFCGTMVSFSLYLLLRILSVILLSFVRTYGYLFLFGSRLLSVILVLLFLYSPICKWLQNIIRDGGITIQIVSVDIVLTVILGFAFFAFDINRFMDNILLCIFVLMSLLLLDCIMLYFHGRRMQEQKHIYMVEQYIPIIEELISQVRARQHEFNNQICAIEAAVNSAETLEDAKANLSLLTQREYIEPYDYDLLSCDSKIVAGILFEKKKQAEFRGINVQPQIQGLFRKGITPEIEWIEVIAILIDNAIEASNSGNTIYLKSRQEENGIEFTVSNPAPPLSNSEFIKLFSKGVTTKPDKQLHGYGLYNVMHIVEHYRGKIITRNEQVDDKNYVVFGVRLP